jgi:hypothetical protein
MTRTTNRERSCVLAAMKQAGAPLTRAEFLSWFYLGDVPDVIPPEDEAEFPEAFQQEMLDMPIGIEKIQ